MSCVALGFSWLSVKGLSARLSFSSFLLFGIFCGSAGGTFQKSTSKIIFKKKTKKKKTKNIAKEKRNVFFVFFFLFCKFTMMLIFFFCVVLPCGCNGNRIHTLYSGEILLQV